MMKRIINFDAMFFMLAAYVLTKGLLKREESFLTAETGTGYMLGIIGGSMMLLLMLYPMRKYTRFMRNMGLVKYWFRIHMLFGVAGPILVLFHSNFNLGSTNSSIALICMLIVAGSGLFGRFFYSRIHEGLYGRKIRLVELESELEGIKENIEHQSPVSMDLGGIRNRLLQPRSAVIMLMLQPYVEMRLFLLRRSIIKQLSVQSSAHEQQQQIKLLQQGVVRYFNRIKRVYGFLMYERLFSLWHVLHIPLFVMMVISGIVHVIAVHIY